MEKPTNQDFNQDFLDMLTLLNEEHVRYLIIGGYAVGAYGYARATKDIDFWLDTSEENSLAVLRVLDRFGHTLQNLSVEDFQDPETVIQIGLPPRRIDFVMSAKALTFEEAWDNRTTLRIGNTPIFVIDIVDLITNKKAVNRDRDKKDVRQLEKFL